MTASAPPHAPLLRVQGARVDRDGSALCEALAFEVDGDRVVLTGAGAIGIVDAITMQARVTSGTALIDGHDVRAHEHIGRVGIAPLDPPLPPRMTVDGYLTLAFRTAGLSSKAAQLAASGALSDLGITELTRRRTESLAVPERRAVILAAAMLPSTRCLVAESPLAGLEGPASHYLLAVLGHLAKRRKVLASAVRSDAASAERDLIMGATHVLVVDRRHVLWSGTSEELLASRSLFTLGVRDPTPAFIEALQAGGFDVRGTPPRLSVALAQGTCASDIIAIAERCATTVIELTPLIEASSPQEAAHARELSPRETGALPPPKTHVPSDAPVATDDAPSQQETS